MSNNSAANSSNAIQTFSEAFRVGTATFTIVLALCTIFGNVLVIVAFSSYARMRTVTNYFVVSLACTDLCVAIFSMPVWVAYLITGPLWVLGIMLSRVWTMVDILMGTASILNLTAISYDRVLCIRSPLWYSQWMTPRKVTLIITCVWIYSLSMAVASFFLFAKPIFNLVVMIMCFSVPLLVILIAYSIVFQVALRHIRQIQATASVHNPGSHNSFLKELKAAKILAVVVGVFVICWAPFVALNVIYSLCAPSHGCSVIDPEIILLSKSMHYGNSMLNPIIYSVMNRDFRRAFKALLFLTNRSSAEEIFTSTRAAAVANSLQMG